MPVPVKPSRIALIAMPWSLFNRPSVQLGTLKAYVESNSRTEVDCYHPYIETAQDIGLEQYQYLCENGWAADALYAALLFPEKKKDAKRLFRQETKDSSQRLLNFDSLSTVLQTSLTTWIDENELDEYMLIGFTVCFNQLLPSLLAAKAIKEKYPDIPIVFGGSSCVGNMGISMQAYFNQVDYVIQGEGEIQLLRLCENIAAAEEKGGEKKKVDLSGCSTAPFCDLAQLPPPDYADYFAELELHFPGLPFTPRIPIEFSRGCWWRKCTFCNLNLQWHGYRFKEAAQVVDEVKQLVGRHKCLDFTFCDNALPPKQADSFFQEVSRWHVDLDFFAEIRAMRGSEKLPHYRQAGLSTVQVGIEALSNSLLERMAKGASVIENLAIMKYCMEHDITLEGNLIVEFPGTTEKEIMDTLDVLDYTLPFHPLSAATFFLGSGSAVDKNPKNFGIQAIVQHHKNRLLFPTETLQCLDLLIKDFRGDRTRQRKMWQPIREKISRWQQFHSNRPKQKTPPLSYRDGLNFIVIRQEQITGKPLLHRLRGASRKLYLFCHTVRKLEEITAAFPSLSEKSILIFFDDLSKKHLLYRENQEYLALAIRQQ